MGVFEYLLRNFISLKIERIKRFIKMARRKLGNKGGRNEGTENNVYLDINTFQDDPQLQVYWTDENLLIKAIKQSGFGNKQSYSNPKKENKVVIGKTKYYLCDSCKDNGIECSKIIRTIHKFDERNENGEKFYKVEVANPHGQNCSN